MLIDDILDPSHKNNVIVSLNDNPNMSVADLLFQMAPNDTQIFNLTGLDSSYRSLLEKGGFRFSRQVFNSRPPYAKTWMEFEAPDILNARIGALLTTKRVGEVDILRQSLVSERKKLSNEECYEQPRDLEDTENFKDVYATTASLIALVDGIYFALPEFIFTYHEKTGKPISVPMNDVYPIEPVKIGRFDSLLLSELRIALGKRAGMLWYATTLLSCKNVEHEKIQRDQKLQKARQRKGKPPLKDYYVLNVVLPQTKASGIGVAGGIKKRFHTVRGHPADYTEGKGLFGKFHGIYWIPAHARGDKNEGNIAKRYDLSA